MDEKILVAYVSKGGAAARYAEVIAEVLRGYGEAVDVVDLRRVKRPPLDGYGRVVLGTGVRIGRVYGRARKFLRGRALKAKKVAVFLASGIAVDEPARAKAKFLDPLVTKAGIEPVMHDVFPGKLPGPNGALEDRTDPELARRWARELADRW